jgi:hypothetical protein
LVSDELTAEEVRVPFTEAEAAAESVLLPVVSVEPAVARELLWLNDCSGIG